MTEKEKSSIKEFLEKKLKDAENKCGENSKEIAFINAAKEAVEEKRTEKPSPINDLKKYFSYHLCPDQYVGKIADFKNENEEVKEDFPVRVNVFAGQTADVCMDFSSYDQIMILIFESPHQDEFDKKGNPIGLANGDAGANIRDYILEIFGNHYEDYHLVLMNPIPFQCSLGCHPQTYFRNKIFSKIWNNSGSSDFYGRFDELWKKLQDKSTVVVNACTAIKEKSNIQKILEEITDRFILQLYHPSYNWCAKKGELREKVKSAGLYKEKASEK